MLNHVERKVVKATETPDGDQKQQTRSKVWMIDQQQTSGGESSEQKQESLGDEDTRSFQIAQHFRVPTRFPAKDRPNEFALRQ